jgi:hypothetical protein
MSEPKNRQKRYSVKKKWKKGVLSLYVFLSGVKNLLLRVRVRLLLTRFSPTCLFPTSFFLRLWF